MKLRLRMLLTAVAVVVSASGPAAGAPCGDDGGGSNWAGSCETQDNQLRCGEGTLPPSALVVITAGANGVEACNDGMLAPAQGRVGVHDGCFCIYADGDADNPEQVRGWARLDRQGALICTNPGHPSYDSGNC